MTAPPFREFDANISDRSPQVTPRELARLTPAAATATTLYTVPDNTVTQVVQIRVFAVTGATVEIWHVRSGAARALTDKIYNSGAIAANGTDTVTETIYMDAGDTIDVESDQADTNFFAYGLEIQVTG